jgi:hypothetical protein
MSAPASDAHSTTDSITTVRDGRPMVSITIPRYFVDYILELLDDEAEHPPADVRKANELRLMQQRFARLATLFERRT